MDLFGVNFRNLTFNEALEEIASLIDNGKKTVVFTPNVDHITKISKDKNFRDIYGRADLVLNDSRVLYFASRMLGAPLRGKISGSDLLPALCTVAAKKNYRIFFLGGNKDSASIAAQKLREINKSVKIVGTLSPVFGFEKIDLEVNKIIGEINKLNPEILFVGLGCPKQEKFIDDHRDRLNALLIAGVRASFEFASGAIRRSPQWMQDCALEWLYRLIKEPGRLWKRYLVSNTYFIFLFTKKYLQMIFRIDKKQ